MASDLVAGNLSQGTYAMKALAVTASLFALAMLGLNTFLLLAILGEVHLRTAGG